MTMSSTIEQSVDLAAYITVAEAERLFSLGTNTAYPHVRPGGAWFPFTIRLGKRVLINRAELMKWAAANQGKVA